MQFSKIAGVWVEPLEDQKKYLNQNNNYFDNNKTFKNSKIFNNKSLAFSLIELSIVLIIIGLLVAGVTGGASLIESARIKGVMTEFEDYKRAVYTFVAEKGRFPGDVNNIGYLGHTGSDVYDDNTFGAPYVSSNTEYGLPDGYAAPWIDLYRAGITDYEPKKITPKSGRLTYSNGGGIPSKIEKKVSYIFTTVPEDIPISMKALSDNFKPGFYLRSHVILDNKIKTEFAEKFDKKFDDGLFNSGILRSQCNPGNGSSGYDIATSCVSIWYFLNI